MALSICKICGESHDRQSGFLTRHILEVHDLSLEDYVVKTEYDGIAPKCLCGYCDERPSFQRGKFKTHATGHKKFDYMKDMYIKIHGIPKCPACGNDIESWHRGKPGKYCNIKCRPGTWNQHKIKETVRERYGVDNVFQVDSVKEKIQDSIDRDAVTAAMMMTKKERSEMDPNYYKDMLDKQKITMQNRYGVDHPSQIEKNRKYSSERMRKVNPMFDQDVVKKATDTLMYNLKSGKTKLYKTQQYKNTDLYYQGSYELDFLELCESKGILDRVSNGNSYEYLDESYGHRLITDFCIDAVEIEIKSTYIMKKQGGIGVLNAKRLAVESIGRQYIVVLDKDYSEFLKHFGILRIE